MIEIVPVSVRSSEDGGRWYAKGLTYSALGQGGTPNEALTRLKEAVVAMFPNSIVELRIRSVSVTFPSSLSEDDFLDLDWVKDKAERVG